MFRSLYSKLAFVLFCLFCLTGFFFICLTIFSTNMYQNEINQKLNLKLAENIVAEKLLMKDKEINNKALEEIFHMLMVINPSIELYLIDPQGSILSYSAPNEKVKLKKVRLEPVRKWFSKNRVLPVMGEDPRHPGEKKAVTIARIPARGEIEGYLYIILGGENYDNILQKLKGSYILQVTIWAVVAVLVFAVLSGFIVFAFLTRRLKKLSLAMDEFRKTKRIEEFSKNEAPEKSIKDEIDRLDNAFIEMARHIQNQMEKIKNSDRARRDLVANISHDLRTPIATLQGYIETLLLKDETILPMERKNYLVTAEKHCKRLSSLVENLFELAKLDAKESPPFCEPFNISDLIQDVIMKFRLSAEKKSITLEVDQEDGLPLVNADISLIERVIENLVENGVRYTKNRGNIKIILSSLDDKVKVCVKDTGIGIVKEELSNIFKRFYQVEKSRNDDSSHSGLGLAISKRILQLHGEDIKVSSIPGMGSVFCFTLEAHESS